MRIPVLHTAAGKGPFLVLLFSSLTEEETGLTMRPQQTSQSQRLQRQSNFSWVECGTRGLTNTSVFSAPGVLTIWNLNRSENLRPVPLLHGKQETRLLKEWINEWTRRGSVTQLYTMCHTCTATGLSRHQHHHHQQHTYVFKDSRRKRYQADSMNILFSFFLHTMVQVSSAQEIEWGKIK